MRCAIWTCARNMNQKFELIATFLYRTKERGERINHNKQQVEHQERKRSKKEREKGRKKGREKKREKSEMCVSVAV